MTTYLPLGCLAGECGLVVVDSDQQCPVPCATQTRCSTCLRSPRCGWCGLGHLNGVGVCMEGGYAGPLPAVGLCSDSDVRVMNESLSGNHVHFGCSLTCEPLDCCCCCCSVVVDPRVDRFMNNLLPLSSVFTRPQQTMSF